MTVMKDRWPKSSELFQIPSDDTESLDTGLGFPGSFREAFPAFSSSINDDSPLAPPAPLGSGSGSTGMFRDSSRSSNMNVNASMLAQQRFNSATPTPTLTPPPIPPSEPSQSHPLTHSTSAKSSGAGSLRRRLGSFSSHKSKEKDDSEKKSPSGTKKSPTTRRPRTAGDNREPVGISSNPVYSSSISSKSFDHSSSRRKKEKRWSFDGSGSGNGAGGAAPSAQAVAVASFAEINPRGAGLTPKKSAQEKDLMWDELMRRSDRAPGGTLHANIEGAMTHLPSDDIEGSSIFSIL